MLEITLLLCAAAVVAFVMLTGPTKKKRSDAADAAAKAVRNKLDNDGSG